MILVYRVQALVLSVIQRSNMRTLIRRKYVVTLAERDDVTKLHKVIVRGTSKLEARQEAMAKVTKRYRIVSIKEK